MGRHIGFFNEDKSPWSNTNIQINLTTTQQTVIEKQFQSIEIKKAEEAEEAEEAVEAEEAEIAEIEVDTDTDTDNQSINQSIN